MGLLTFVRSYTNWHDAQLKRLLFGAPKPSTLDKAMKAFDAHPNSTNDAWLRHVLKKSLKRNLK